MANSFSSDFSAAHPETGHSVTVGAGRSVAGSARWLLAVVLLVTALPFMGALGFDFVYDDAGQIVGNPFVHSWRFVPQYFAGHVWQHMYPAGTGNYYRPFNLLWFRLNHALFGLQPSYWHATTILLHLLVTGLVFAIARRLTGRPLVAALAALVFGVHPMRHGVVAWVSGTTESLWATFFLLGFLAYLKSRQGNRAVWMGLSCAAYAGALLSKETGIVLPALIFAHAWLFRSGERDGSSAAVAPRFGDAAATSLAYAPVAIAYLIVRMWALGGLSPVVSGVTAGSTVLTLPSVLWFYVRQWLLPIQMAEFYDIPLRGQFDVAGVLLPLLALSAVAAALVWGARKLGGREIAFASVWMMLPLLPALYPAALPPEQLVHDRYFYVPSLGAALLVGLVLERLAAGKALVWGYPRRLVFSVLALLVLLCYGTATASSYWVDDYTLLRRSYAISPKLVVVRDNLAVDMAVRGDHESAIRTLQDLVTEKPSYWRPHYNLGRALYEVGRLDEAAYHLQQAQKIAPAEGDIHLQLGLVALKKDRLEEAAASIRRSVTLRPQDPSSRFALGVVLAAQGRCDEARGQFAEALRLKPDLPRGEAQVRACVARSEAAEDAAERGELVPAAEN